MKLSDVMGAADLAIYAEVGLVLFLLAFAGVVFRVMNPRNNQEYESLQMLPLNDEVMSVRAGAPRSTETETDR